MHRRPVFGKTSHRHAEGWRTTCGQKKCFFSQTKNHLAETESQIHLRNAKKTNRKPSKGLKEPNEKTSQPLYLPSFAGFRFDIMSAPIRPERQN